jgi:hypothetical protein
VSDIEDILVKAAGKALSDELPNFEKIVSPDFNIFESVDSFSVVNILLESESVIENLIGKYVPLANEKIFDAINSPLLKWQEWIDYVSNIVDTQRK